MGRLSNLINNVNKESKLIRYKCQLETGVKLTKDGIASLSEKDRSKLIKQIAKLEQ